MTLSNVQRLVDSHPVTGTMALTWHAGPDIGQQPCLDEIFKTDRSYWETRIGTLMMHLEQIRIANLSLPDDNL